MSLEITVTDNATGSVLVWWNAEWLNEAEEDTPSGAWVVSSGDRSGEVLHLSAERDEAVEWAMLIRLAPIDTKTLRISSFGK